MYNQITLDKNFLSLQLERATKAANCLTNSPRMTKEDTQALQFLADICRALRSPILENAIFLEESKKNFHSLKQESDDSTL